MIKVNYWKTFILFLFCWNRQYAQFRPVLIEGDYAPVAVKLTIEEQNKKHKDAPHVYFDKERNLWHTAWTQFDVYKSKLKRDLSVIYYSRSDEGKSWGTPKQLNTVSGDCLDGDSTVKGPMPCVGTLGEVYVAWAAPQGLAFQRSLDSGKTWLKEEKIIAPIKKGWASKVDGLKTNGLPFIACDLSKGEFRGRIYVCWSDEKNGEKNKDVFLVYSDDKGEHWTEPVLVSYRPNHKEQFKPCMKVDTILGYLYLLYFDKQNFSEGKETDLYLALSKNGGLKFDYYKVNERSFLFNSNFMELLDDNGMKARWVQVDGSKRFGLYEVLVNDSTISSYNLGEYNNEMQIERSFKFTDKIKLDFKIKTNTFLSVVITKPLEPGFEKVVVKNKRVFAGKNNLMVDTKALGLKKGNYVITFYYANRNTYVWIMEE
jgi:hypothetical protein